MDRFDDDSLAAELRALRPQPRPEFTAELDQRAAAGFPRGADTTASVFAPLVDWWRGLNPTRRMVPILGVALAVVVLATAAVAISQSGGANSAAENATLGMANPAQSSSSAESFGAAEAESGPAQPVRPAHSGSHHAGGAGQSSGEMTYEVEIPSIESTPKAGAKKAGANAGTVNGPAASAEAEESAPVEAESTGSEERIAPDASQKTSSNSASGRDIERSSYIVLGTKPGEVAGAAAKVYEAVHAAGGYVLNSSVQSGSTGATGATFELSIPTAKLDDALGAISSIAEVRERHDATNDITAPTVSVSEELADSNAAIEGLLKQLGEVETEAEQESVEARLREERRHHAAIRASLDHLHERASMSEVSVRIVTNQGAGVTPPSTGSGGDWGVGDALHDAGHILTIVAGVVLVGLAVLAPFALLALILWAGNSFRVRRLRERTLG
jgi:hypothetical protein